MLTLGPVCVIDPQQQQQQHQLNSITESRSGITLQTEVGLGVIEAPPPLSIDIFQPYRIASGIKSHQDQRALCAHSTSILCVQLLCCAGPGDGWVCSGFWIVSKTLAAFTQWKNIFIPGKFQHLSAAFWLKFSFLLFCFLIVLAINSGFWAIIYRI